MERAVQTNKSEILKHSEKEKDRIKKRILEIIEGREDYEGPTEIIDKDWPKEAFAITKIETIDINKINRNQDIALIIDSKTKTGDRELEDIEEDTLKLRK